MMLLFLENIKSAFRSIWQNKVQSFLAILGVIIGVSAVTILVGLGQGLKNDVSNLIEGFGTNVLFVVSGKIDPSATSAPSNPANFLTGDILTLKDVDSVTATPGVEHVSPLSLVPGNLKIGEKTSSGTVVGTYPNALSIFNVLHLDHGSMFASSKDSGQIVLSEVSAHDLFYTADPVGSKITIGTHELTVVGVLAKSKSSSVFGSQLDSLSFIPFDTATMINKNQVRIYRIAVKAADSANVTEVKGTVKSIILRNHNNEEDFSVLTQDDLLGLLNTFLNLATTLVSAIAAISLVVGGIGIMNIMLVTVTERTREIGLRKAVGATKRAILIQFLTESLVITSFGGVLGLVISFIVIAIVKAKTTLVPDITPQIILLAVGIAAAIGVIFGLWPALRAASKDPIEALRYE